MTVISNRGLKAVLVTAVVVLSVAAVPLSATAAKPNPSPINDDEVFNASDSVTVWERGAFPLRSDNTVAQTQVKPPNARAQGVSTGDKGLVVPRDGDRNPLGVFDKDETISFDFMTSRAGGPSSSSLDSANVQIVAARIDDSGNGVPTTFSEYLDLTEPDKANDNASFEMIDPDRPLTDGETTFSYQPTTAGYYVFFVAMNESGQAGYTVTNGPMGDLDRTGNVTILGTTGVTVQEAPPTTLSHTTSVTRGDPVVFDLDTSAAFANGDDVTHIVALYKQDTFTGSTQRIKVQEDQLGPDFNISDHSTLESSIGETKGVADVDPGVTINGESLSNGRITRAIGIETGVDFLAEELGSNPPDIDRIQPESTLFGSVEAVSGQNHTTTVTVETTSEFDTGTYQWVYLAKLDDGDVVKSTAAGTLSVTSGTSPPPSTGGSTGDDDDDTGTTAASSGSANRSI